ncbi:rhomboid-related protein 4, partial [Eurytemora carolleeae]|uniref:rhomboid-related protein 4 n=1 Tax=Eurytemora carolleeae TaxID=1294199 RepID=UPI000C77F829
MRRGRVPELGIILLGLQLVRNIGVTNIPPVTCLAILGQVGVYLQMLVVPRLCLSGEGVWVKGEYLRLVVPALRHTHDIHLYYNMVSLAWKGIQLERRLGSIRFFFTLVLLTLMSGIAYVLLAVLAADLSEDYSYMQQCSIGFSGVLFALKVLTSKYSSETDRESYFGFLVPIRYGVWLELLLIQVLVPNTSFIGHLGGILAGLVLVKGPIGGISSIFRSYSMVPFGPGCLLLCLGLVTQYTGYFNGHPLTGCLPTRDLFYQSWAQPSLQGAKYIILSPLYHLGI